MENTKGQISFEQIIERGCGLDIHKSILVATIRGFGIVEETSTFDGFAQSIESLRDWLKENGIIHVAMESTGVHWNLLKGSFIPRKHIRELRDLTR